MAKTILLVEDEPSLRRLAERLLQKMGYRGIVVASGEDALAWCRDHADRIDLLVTDVFMPGMGGPELANQIDAVRPGTKVLYVSGSDEALNADNHEVPARGTFLQKPFTAADFGKKIREVIENENGLRA